jgi:NADPH-dependent glutamate synthase beta subunit-like oxidoreductase
VARERDRDGARLALRPRRRRHRPVEAAHRRADSSRASPLDARGCVVADAQTGATGNPKVFSGGDCVNGGKEVVNAVAEGRNAARHLLATWSAR